MKLKWATPLMTCASFLLLSCSTSPPLSTTPTRSEVSLWSVVNEKGLVDYAGLVKSPHLIADEYQKITAKSPDSHPTDFPTQNDRFAYWLNAYNISAIYGVTKIYPIHSVQDHKVLSLYSLFPGGAFFAAQKFTFGGKRYSLYKLENKLIRKRFKDPRLHFGLNCASTSCPDLAPLPFRGETLDQQLDQLTRAFINSPKGVHIDDKAKEIQLSAIFDWYADDFESGVLEFIEPYLKTPQKLRSARKDSYKITYLPYDWSLNVQP